MCVCECELIEDLREKPTCSWFSAHFPTGIAILTYDIPIGARSKLLTSKVDDL